MDAGAYGNGGMDRACLLYTSLPPSGDRFTGKVCLIHLNCIIRLELEAMGQLCIRDRISAVDHHIVTDVDTHMADTGGIIRSGEKHQSARLDVGRGYRRTDIA